MQLQFNIYGFIIGIAIVVGIFLIEKQIQEEKLLQKIFYKFGGISFLFSIIGARAWHVATDFYLYRNNLTSIFFIWNGGLSIFGGILGGILGLVFSSFVLRGVKEKSLQVKKDIILKLLDYSVFGLPIGQAIGRLGNYFNQELYGLPTTGFFKIYIDKNHRLPGFENIEYYHPLFIYEMVAMGLFALILFFVQKKRNVLIPKIGTGKLFLVYVLYYSVTRFFLDFLRIDKAVVLGGDLGTNQMILAGFICVVLVASIFRIIKRYV